MDDGGFGLLVLGLSVKIDSSDDRSHCFHCVGQSLFFLRKILKVLVLVVDVWMRANLREKDGSNAMLIGITFSHFEVLGDLVGESVELCHVAVNALLSHVLDNK